MRCSWLSGDLDPSRQSVQPGSRSRTAVSPRWQALPVMGRTGLAIAASLVACGLLGCTATAQPTTAEAMTAGPTTVSKPGSPIVTAPVSVAEQVAKTRAMLAQL